MKPPSLEEIEAAGSITNIEEIRIGRGDELRAILAKGGLKYEELPGITLAQLDRGNGMPERLSKILREGMEATMKVVARDKNGEVAFESEEPDCRLQFVATCLALELALHHERLRACLATVRYASQGTGDDILTCRNLGLTRGDRCALCLGGYGPPLEGYRVGSWCSSIH